MTPTLRRARLLDWLNEVSGCRAVVLAADAGYGKTTLLWQWEREVDFREGEHPQYLISTVDVVQLNRELVATDLMELRRLNRALDGPHDVASRAALARQLVELARGEYLADLKYEDWVATNQLGVHSEVRAALLPIAQGASIGPTDDWALRAGCALAAIDPFDETAHVAMIRHLAATGRGIQARSLAGEFSRRLKREFDEEPSDELRLAASLVGADGLIRVD